MFNILYLVVISTYINLLVVYYILYSLNIVFDTIVKSILLYIDIDIDRYIDDLN